MKILFITPLLNSFTVRWMPLGICSMAAVLKSQGHDVFLFDRTVEFFLLGQNRQKLDSKMKLEIQAIAPDIIAFSTITPAIHDTKESVDLIGTFFKGIMIAGGHHATALPDETLIKIPQLHGIVIGEGEYALAAMANGSNPAHIPGFRLKSNLLSDPTVPGRISLLDDLPFPLIELLNIPYYTEANSGTIRGFYLSTACLLTSRGCYFNCSYCSESLTYGKGVRFHSPEYVVENIRQILTHAPVNGIYVLDNDFLADPERADKICRLLINHKIHKKIKWAIQTRTDRITPDIVKLLKTAGCVKIEMGVESSDASVLKNINKTSTISHTLRAINLCREHGLKIHAYMLTGFEGESLSDLDRQLKWLKKIAPDTFSWGQIQLYPGTMLYNQKGNRFFETHDWSHQDVNAFFTKDHLTSIDPRDRKKWMAQNLDPYMWWTLTRSHLTNNDLTFILTKLKNKIRLKAIIENSRHLKQLFMMGK